MIKLDIHWPSFFYGHYKANKLLGLSPNLLINRVLERIKLHHEKIAIGSVYLGTFDLDHEIYNLFYSLCASNEIKESCDNYVEKIFYYISHFDPSISETTMRDEANNYIITNNKLRSGSGLKKIMYKSGNENYQINVSPFLPFEYSKRFILNSFTLGRYDTFYSINDASLNTTSPLRRYSSSLSPHYSSFSPLGGLYVFYNCCTDLISTMGHRFADSYVDHLYKNRDNYYIIGIFGGSAAYSIFCADSEYFGNKIANNLSNIGINSHNKKIAVINFALPGTTIFEARLFYTMEAAKLMPDLCILHFGWNESRLGPTTHPSLAKLGIYLNHFSNSTLVSSNPASRCHVTEDCSELPDFPSTSHTAFSNYLYESIILFNDMIGRYDSKLILGMQPIIRTGRSYSNQFHRFLSHRESDLNTYYQETLYRVLPKLLIQNSDLHFVNLDERIYDLESQNSESDDFIFMDACHLNAKGDAIIAEIYSQYIISNILC